MKRCVQWERFYPGMVVTGWWLDWMTLMVFPTLTTSNTAPSIPHPPRAPGCISYGETSWRFGLGERRMQLTFSYLKLQFPVSITVIKHGRRAAHLERVHRARHRGAEDARGMRLSVPSLLSPRLSAGNFMGRAFGGARRRGAFPQSTQESVKRGTEKRRRRRRETESGNVKDP